MNELATMCKLLGLTSNEDLVKKLGKEDPMKLMPNFEDVEITKILADELFTIYLGFSSNYNQEVVLKVFSKPPHQLSEDYIRESRIYPLEHPNIVKYLQVAHKVELGDVNASIIFMEKCKCDFLAFNSKISQDRREMFARTFFHDLIEGIDYLHSNGICHLNLKLDVLLLDNDYRLRIGGFDHVYLEGDSEIRYKGSKNYRAPETLSGKVAKPYAADVYSAGIILFVLRFGVLAYTEDKIEADLFGLLMSDPIKYFEILTESMTGAEQTMINGFKSLFLGMVKEKPEDRKTIDEIKDSLWYGGPVYSKEELKKLLDELIQ